MRPFLLSVVCLLLSAMPPLAAEETPRRIVSLSWALTEMLVELDVTPVGVADVDGYRQWVGQPALPEAVVGVGLGT